MTEDKPRPAVPKKWFSVIFGVTVLMFASIPGQAEARSAPKQYPLRHYASLVPQPRGMPTNSCYQRSDQEAKYYHCRLIKERMTTIPSPDKDVVSYSETDGKYGFNATMRDGSVLEGCRWVDLYTVRCDYAGTNHWTRKTLKGHRNYYLEALKKSTAPAKCANQLARFWKGNFDWNSFLVACEGIDF